MGLTKSSTGSRLLADDLESLKSTKDFTIALAGNPNVGKSTIFNALTGMHQHTGNWPGKTVENTTGECSYLNKSFLFVDIPGTYSILSNSEEEEIARDYICFSKPDVTVVVVDATCLERNLNLVFQTMEITKNVIVCVNLLDEAKKKGISVDLEKLSSFLGVPVVGTTARKKKTLKALLHKIYEVCMNKIQINSNLITYNDEVENSVSVIENYLKEHFCIDNHLYRWVSLKLLDNEPHILNTISQKLDFTYDAELKEIVQNEISNFCINNKCEFKDTIISCIMSKAEYICKEICTFPRNKEISIDRKIDNILTSKKFGIPIMILFLGFIFWLTIVGSNYPSQILFDFFSYIQEKLINLANFIHMPSWLSNMLILGIYQTLTWIISVMLPPMAIFFPLFTFLEDLGYLPRIAFNMDGLFKKCCCTGKQMITMCMGVTKL